MSVHARFSPSKLPRILRCPGSVVLSEGIQNAQSAYASEGSYLHGIVEDHLTRDVYRVATTLHEDRQKHLDYTNAVNDILDFVFTLKAANPDERMLEFIETRVSLKDYAAVCSNALLEEVEGTADYVLYTQGTLYVCDWKFGKGVAVSADSDQLTAYSAGALSLLPKDFPVEKIIRVVYQPRLDYEPHKESEISHEELMRWVKFVLSPGLLMTEAKEPILHASEHACKWCPAGLTCRERHNQALRSAERVFAAHTLLPNNVTYEELAKVLDMIPQLEQYIKDLNAFVFNGIVAGNQVPGYKVVRGRSNRVWKDGDKAQIVLEERGFDTSDMLDIKFQGPAKVEKLIPKAERTAEWFTSLIDKPEGKPTLVNESDKREPLHFASPEEVFANFIQPED